MSAAAALARAEAAGVRFRLAPGGGVRMEAAAPPPPDVLADLRRWREDVAALLAARKGQAARPAAPPAPAAWWRLPYGEARGRAFAEARAMPGACPCCAGRRWWREADEAPPGRCMACHPPPPGLPLTVTETRAGTYRPGDPEPLRDGLLCGARDHRSPR